MCRIYLTIPWYSSSSEPSLIRLANPFSCEPDRAEPSRDSLGVSSSHSCLIPKKTNQLLSHNAKYALCVFSLVVFCIDFKVNTKEASLLINHVEHISETLYISHKTPIASGWSTSGVPNTKSRRPVWQSQPCHCSLATVQPQLWSVIIDHIVELHQCYYHAVCSDASLWDFQPLHQSCWTSDQEKTFSFMHKKSQWPQKRNPGGTRWHNLLWRYSNQCNSTIAFNMSKHGQMSFANTNLWESCKISMSLSSHGEQGIMYNFDANQKCLAFTENACRRAQICSNFKLSQEPRLSETNFGGTSSIIQNAKMEEGSIIVWRPEWAFREMTNK